MSQHTRHATCRKAFTLIELLVVISIISLLIAVLLPVLQKARAASHVSVSLSNLRQITLAQIAYTSDNRGELPLVQWISPTANTNQLRWSSVLVRDGYLASRRVYWSPAKPTQDLLMDQDSWLHFNPWRHVGYGMNHWIGKSEGSSDIPFNLNINSKVVHGKGILLTESVRNNGTHWLSGNFNIRGENTGMTANSIHVFTYSGRATRSYIDGHALADDARNIDWKVFDALTGEWTLVTINDVRRDPWYRDWRP